jgi:hypothetical protein
LAKLVDRGSEMVTQTTVVSRNGARSRVRRWDPRMALACAVVSAPVIGEFVRVWRSSFYPTGDDAVEGILARDVFSLHPPLIGMYSGISAPGRPFVYHLGPMVFWALAIPERLLPARLGIVIAASIVNIVAAVALLRSVRRTYDTTAALAAAAIVAITFWSMGRNTLAEPWTPYIALIPLMLVLVYSLELANGALRPLPWTVLAASFVAQAHYIYVAVVFASVAGGIVLGVVARRRTTEDASEAAPDDRNHRAVVAAIGVAVVCWALPLLDMIVHWPGNLTHWVEALQRPQGAPSTASQAWAFVARSVGWVPLAGRGPLPAGALNDLSLGITRLANAAALVAVGCVVALAFALRRRAPRVARFAASAAVLVGALLFAMWRLPWTSPVMPSYRITMLWPVGAYVWTAALVGLLTLCLRPSAVAALRRRVRSRSGTTAVATVAIVAAITAVVGVDAGRPNPHTDWSATNAVVGPTLAQLPRGRSYLMRGDGNLGYSVQYGVMRAMLDHGYATSVAANDVYLQHDHTSTKKPDTIVLVTSAVGPLPRNARLIAQYQPNAVAQRARLQKTREAAVAALREQPLQLTAYGERQLRGARGTVRTVLEAVVHHTATPDLLADASVAGSILFSRVHPDPSRVPFVVGPDIVPTLTAYIGALDVITSQDVRVALMPAR